MSSLHLGTFNAEYFWKPTNMAGFPTVIDPQNRNLIYAMDELLALAMSHPTDYLLTRFGFLSEHKEYLNQMGFKFKGNLKPVVTPSANGHNGFQCISSLPTDHISLTNSVTRLKPYSITPGINSLARQMKLRPLPANATAAKVNSKTYSSKLSQTLVPDYQGKTLSSSEAIRVQGEPMLKDSSRIVLKESYGVAGNGNLIIDSEKALERIARHFTKQEHKDKEVSLVAEPFYDKIIDFSSQWEISEDGTLTFLGFQEMVNEGFAFNKIRPLSARFEGLIQESNYLEIINKALLSIYQEGYYGPVCFDSMILRDQSIVPIVEINARMSMGLLNLKLNEAHFEKGAEGTLFHVSLLVPSDQQKLYDKVRLLLKQLQLDFSAEQPTGFMVLSANTLGVNAKLNPDKPYRARLYLWHRSTNKNTLIPDISRLCTALSAEGIKVQ